VVSDLGPFQWDSPCVSRTGEIAWRTLPGFVVGFHQATIPGGETADYKAERIPERVFVEVGTPAEVLSVALFELGKNCRKGSFTCYCAVGFPYEKMCPDCRDGRAPDDVYSRCVCPPPVKP
jgi:hypothetical protein